MSIKNKGFVLLETIIVMSVLLIGMILLYSNYNRIFMNSGKISYYDNVEDMYTAYYVYLNKDTINTNSKEVVDVSDNKVLDNLGIERIYFIDKDVFTNLYTKKVTNCGNLDSLDCFDGTTIAYLKSIENKSDVDKCEENNDCLTIVKIKRGNHYYFAKYEAYNIKQDALNGDDPEYPTPDPITPGVPDVPDVPEITQKIYNYSFKPDYQTFTAPIKATYQIELWGAKGGGTKGGKGSYVKGNIELEQGETIYIYVGGQGDSNGNGGYNGGGNVGVSEPINHERNDGGGGATDVRLVSGLWNNKTSLNSRIMVAAGGGGANNDGTNKYGYGFYGGPGRGLTGSTAEASGSSIIQNMTGKDASQTSGGAGGESTAADGNDGNRNKGNQGGFGYGGNGQTSKNTQTLSGGAGGGSGYYGGGSGEACASNCGGAGGGGSSYISGHTGCVAIASQTSISPRTANGTSCTNGTTTNLCSVHYSNKVFTDTLMIDGSGYKWTTTKGALEQMPNPNGGYYESGTGNSGDGYARITILIDGVYEYKAPSTSNSTPYYTFTAPIAGNYKLETWGAQGGSASSTYFGGYGGYSVGTISLSKGETLYVYVGGQGTSSGGGYNGGGSNYSTGYGGGGATHIAQKIGLLSDLSANISSILIVSGAGGGSINYSESASASGKGGNAGGYIGGNGFYGTWSKNPGKGGTQTAGGSYGLCQDGNICGQSGTFGQGGNKYNGCTTEHCQANYQTGGGGGFYGGGSARHTGAGGGSSYIGNSRLFNKSMYCYECSESSDNSTKTTSTKCHNGTPTSNCSKEGNGYAKITYIGKPTNLG